MRIVVCMKQVYDPKTVKISRSREEFDLREAVKITNPPDKLALEMALRLREANGGGEVIALTAGEAQAEDVVREAIAIGADRGLLIADPGLATAGGRAVAKTLAAAISLLSGVDLVLTGQAGLTDGAGCLAPRLAAELGWPVVLDAVGLTYALAGEFEATVASDAGTILMPLVAPVVVAIAPGPDPIRPRYPYPARIANAWQPGLVEICTPRELGLEAEALAPDLEPGSLVLPPERTRGEVIGGSVQEAAEQLVGMLRARRVVG
jgi:electron transfer flavoprotein beta subunit